MSTRFTDAVVPNAPFSNLKILLMSAVITAECQFFETRNALDYCPSVHIFSLFAHALIQASNEYQISRTSQGKLRRAGVKIESQCCWALARSDIAIRTVFVIQILSQRVLSSKRHASVLHLLKTRIDLI